MPASRRRTALALVLLMIIAPLTGAATANWDGPSSVNPPDEGITLTGFRVPGNATVLDGWVHVTNTQVAASQNNGFAWEGDDFGTGLSDNTVYHEESETLLLQDDGTRSNISDFDDGSITVTMNSDYKFTPGWRHVFESSAQLNYTGCNGGNGTVINHGWDDDFDSNLDANEHDYQMLFCDNGTVQWNFLYSTEAAGSNCEFAGNKVRAGLDTNDNRNLDTSEITNTTYLCHQDKLWQATTFTTLNGNISGDEQTLDHGVVPSEATEGIVAVGTYPGSPVPRGTYGSFILPQVSLPDSGNYNNLYMTFDHWYHVDSTASGGGDGLWMEYRLKDGTWSNWSYVQTSGGYPSTMSTDGPSPNGAPAGALPVWASPTHSGWQSENISLSSLPDVANSTEVQFRFLIWTSPTATNERPGWFLDNFHFNNDGVNFNVWHHGCISSTGNCQYSANAYGALQRTVDLSGTNSTSTIEIDMYWDLQGSYSDNACVELSVNNNTWTDISSSSSATTTICENRAGAIPGYTGDDSGQFRTKSFDIPTAFENQSAVYLRIIVDTDSWTNYGGVQDSQEGLTVSEIRVMNWDDSVMFVDDLQTQSTMYHYGATEPGTTTVGADDWDYHTLIRGVLSESFNFEDSSASSPSISNSPGWSRSGSGFHYGQLGQSAGPADEPSFPYVYGTSLNGYYSSNMDAYLKSPSYTIPSDGDANFIFDYWACFENNWDGAGIFLKVNSGSWNYWEPAGLYTHTGIYGYTDIPTGSGYFGSSHCSYTTVTNPYFTTAVVSLSQYAGDTLQFRFYAGSDSSITRHGFYVDNVGVSIANYGEGGSWLSPSFSVDDLDEFNMGWIDADATVPENTTVRASLMDAVSGEAIAGYDNITFPFSLAGVDTSAHENMRLKVILDTSDEEVTPRLHKIQIGGKRFLTARGADWNDWDFSAGVEIVNDLINATSIAGTITSELIESSRPIKAITLGGNYSGITVTVISPTGATLGQGGQGTIGFTESQNGFLLSIALPTNGWIDRLVLTAVFAEPTRDATMDIVADGTIDWSFSLGDDYGHYGWQSLISDGQSESRSAVLNLDGSSASSVNVRIPSLAAVYGGLITVAADSDGFDAPVTVSVGSSSQTSGSGSIFHNFLDYSQVAGINSLSTAHTDSDTGREWRDVSISIDSNTAQTVSITSFGIGYLMFENVSGFSDAVSAYHDSQTQDDPPPTMVSIPVNFTAEMGSISIDGDLKFDYIITNRDFNVPNTLYPTGEQVEIITKHHHLFDNSNLVKISLRGTASDGEVLDFEVTNGADGAWGTGSDPVTFTQNSGSSVAPLDTASSYVEEIVHNDGYTDIVVHWFFDVSWMWDDVDTIRWVSKAVDADDYTVWPAVSNSGQSGKKAVENDLQIDSFEVRDQFGRLLSNQYSTFYPYTMVDGSELNITGTVRFQDSTDTRPAVGDYSVGLNLSNGLYGLSVGEGGTYSGLVTPPTGLATLELSPMMITVGPTGSSLGANDVTGVPPEVIIRVDSNPPVAGPIQVNTPTGLQNAHGKVWDPTVPLSVFVTVDEPDARGELLTLKYWRESVDDVNGDGIADESEYLSQSQPLTSGMTGQQQVNFAGIDVSGQSFNAPVHMYVEGTDWSGLTYQDGGTGGSAGAENAWASVIVATDEPTSLISSGYSLDRELGYLLPGVEHTFSVQIREANGLNTLDNVSIMLCGDGPDNLGKMSYDPSRGTLWSATDSLVSPISAQTMAITSEIVQLDISFVLSWHYPWEDGQYGCKPSISVLDDLTTVAYQNNIGELTWHLDNRYVAIPDYIADLTPPRVDANGVSVYLGQGDEFRLGGSVFYAGSGVVASDITDDLSVELMVIYGTQEITVETDVMEDGSFNSSMILPSRVPLTPMMNVTTTVLNMPGLGGSDANSDATVTVDSKSPTVLFDQTLYPDSSLTIIESDRVGAVPVTVTMVDEIGMIEGPLDVSWVYLRGNQPVAGSEGTAQLPMIEDGETKDIYQDTLDLTPLNGMKIEQGDQIAFWVTSTDRAGNPVSGLGSESAPRMPTIRIMEFLGDYTRSVINPTTTPLLGEMLTVQTFWENPGKRDGEFEVGLYELKTNPDSTTSWVPAFSTLRDGDVTITLDAQSSSVLHTFQWESWQVGQPLLVLVVNQDFDNENRMNVELTGINVQPLPIEEKGVDPMIIVAAVGALVAIGIVAFVMRGRGGEEYYYEDDDDSYYEEDSWEYEDEYEEEEDSDDDYESEDESEDLDE